MEIWHILIITSIIFLIIEIFLPSFLAGSISVGLLFSAFSNYFEFSTEWQIVFFGLGMILVFFTIRPILLKWDKSKNIDTNKNALIGKSGLVEEEIKQFGVGRVKIDGDFWQAKSLDNSSIQKGDFVEVVNVESIILIVKSLKK